MFIDRKTRQVVTSVQALQRVCGEHRDLLNDGPVTAARLVTKVRTHLDHQYVAVKDSDFSIVKHLLEKINAPSPAFADTAEGSAAAAQLRIRNDTMIETLKFIVDEYFDDSQETQ